MSDFTVNGFEVDFLYYACVESAVGRLLVVMSDKGVVDVLLGDSEMEMLSSAKRRYQNARFAPDRGVRWGWVAAVVKRVELPERPTFVPVDLGFGDWLRPAG